MAGSEYITQADLEKRFPATHVRRVFSDDGSGVPSDRLLASTQVASRRLDAILSGSNWTIEQIEQAVAEDILLRDACCSLAMAHGCQGKLEWSGPSAPYADLETKALKLLKDVAKANLRPLAETIVGKNRVRDRQVNARPKMFASTRAHPKRGGY